MYNICINTMKKNIKSEVKVSGQLASLLSLALLAES